MPDRPSVPAGALRVPPRAARVAVAALDVAQPPRDLRGGVGAPVGADGGHLAAGQRLRDAVRVGAGVVGLGVPAALFLPELVEARHRVEAEAAVEQDRAADAPVAAVLAAGLRDRAGERHGLALGGGLLGGLLGLGGLLVGGLLLDHRGLELARLGGGGLGGGGGLLRGVRLGGALRGAGGGVFGVPLLEQFEFACSATTI